MAAVSDVIRIYGFTINPILNKEKGAVPVSADDYSPRNFRSPSPAFIGHGKGSSLSTRNSVRRILPFSTHDYRPCSSRTSPIFVGKVSSPTAKKSVSRRRLNNALCCSTCSLPIAARNLETGQRHSSKYGCPFPSAVILEMQKCDRNQLLGALRDLQPGIFV
jgi:hypothetical protein